MEVSLPFTPRDWKEFNIKAIVNIYRNNTKRNWMYGPLGSLPVPQIEFLEARKVLKFNGEDFYEWFDVSAIKKWLDFKQYVVENLCSFVKETRKNEKGKDIELKVYTNTYKMNNSDYILTAMNKREIFAPKFPTSGEKIQALEVTNEERLSIVDMYNQFDSKLLHFYKENNISIGVYSTL